MTFEFLNYIPTPGEKHIGIAKIKAFGKIILRYKLVSRKDGQGFFPMPASYKMPSADGQDNYVSAFMLDSNSDKEDVEELIRLNVRKYMGATAITPPEQSLMPSQAPSVYQQLPKEVQPDLFDDTQGVPF